MLAHGELRTVGATTIDEYANTSKDAALEQRFQPVLVNDRQWKTIAILRGLKNATVHHGVRITDSALVAAAVLSQRYITDRFCRIRRSISSMKRRPLKIELDSMPTEST
jgi:ATP-dependent Clp protease ATP-binding subunit ClpB